MNGILLFFQNGVLCYEKVSQFLFFFLNKKCNFRKKFTDIRDFFCLNDSLKIFYSHWFIAKKGKKCTSETSVDEWTRNTQVEYKVFPHVNKSD